ncbi:MAG: hypothetical protein WC454_05685 [Phycisphaerae bacterium]
MKAKYRIILVLAMAAVLSVTALYCRAAEDVNKKEDNIWSEDTAKGEHGRPELTDEKIESIMSQLAETEPNKAKELKQLQEKDPEKFKAELRDVMREQFGKKFREHAEKRPEPFGLRGMQHGPEGMPLGAGMPWRYDKYLDWLKENYADEAKKLAELSTKDPNLYWKQLGHSLKKYGRIAEASVENPQLAEVLKEDLALRQQQDKLLEQIKTADDKKKEELVNDLKEVLNHRFDAILKRKQIEYEHLLKKLERLKKEVEQRSAKVEKWKAAESKNESVKSRLEELLSKTDEFKWDEGD